MPKSDQGSTTDRYTAIPRVLVFVYHGEDVLLIRGAPDKRLWANRYNGLGGHVEPGEEIAAAARREVWEEAGLEVRDLRLRGVVHIDLGAAPAAPAPAAPAPGILIFVFSARSDTRETRPSAEGSLHWLSPGNLAAQGAGDAMVQDVPLLLQRLARDADEPAGAPFTARYHYDADDRLRIEFGDEP